VSLINVSTTRRARDLAGGCYRRVAAVLALLAAGSTAAACGSANPPSSSATGSTNVALVAARCMRAHGVPNFPDPGRKGGMTVLFSPGSTAPTIDGVTFSGPAFQSAAKICKPLGSPGPGPPPVGEQQRRALLAFANCMRGQGIPYADPSFPAAGGVFGGGGSGQDQNSPAFKHAAAACNR
jgi:hypothetical protein